MSAPPQSPGHPITGKDVLIAHMEAGCKPPADWRIGTEHEKFAFTREDLRPCPYDGPRGIRALLEGLAEQFGWQPVYEGENPVALTKDGCNVTLEPGGQLELSGEALENIHETCDEVHQHLAQVKQVAEPLNVSLSFRQLGRITLRRRGQISLKLGQNTSRLFDALQLRGQDHKALALTDRTKVQRPVSLTVQCFAIFGPTGEPIPGRNQVSGLDLHE